MYGHGENTEVIGRFRRFAQLWRSRGDNLSELTSAQSMEAALVGAARNHLAGFNTSAIRLRILYALVRIFGITEFIETGTYHGATAICAHNCFQIPVRSCEASLSNYWVARGVTCGLAGLHVDRARSEQWLPGQVERARKDELARPLFYLDAHAGIEPTSCPILDELSVIVRLRNFLVVIDDFSVPDTGFIGRSYGATQLGPDLIRPTLLSAGIRKIFVPSYSPDLESGHARAGFTVFFRPAALESIFDKAQFPLNLLEPLRLDAEAVV